VSYDDEIEVEHSDVIGIISVVMGTLGLLSWFCCVFASILGLGYFVILFGAALSLVAVITGAVGFMQANEADRSPALPAAGIALGATNLFIVGAYCCTVFTSLAAIIALFAAAAAGAI